MDPEMFDKLLSDSLDDLPDPRALEALEAICARCAQSRAQRAAWMRVQALLAELRAAQTPVDWRAFVAAVRAEIEKENSP